MAIGDIKDGKGGIKYRQIGEDPYDKASWERVVDAPQPAAPEEPSLFDKGKAMLGRAVAMTPPGVVFRGMEAANTAADQLADKAGGAVTDITGSPELGTAANVGVQGASMLLGGGVTRAVASPAMARAAQGLMHSALKPSSKDIISGDAAKAIDTLLTEGANVSTDGAVKLRARISQLEAQAKEMVDKAAQSGAVVDKAYVMSEIAKELKKFRNQVNPGADSQAILKSWDEFRQMVGAKIPVQGAHDLKKGTYKILADKYAKQGAVENVPGTQAQMAMARGLRKGTEEVVPGLGKVTAEESKIINALEIAEKRAGISGNKDIGGIAWLANNPAAALGMMADRSAAFKSWLANRIYQHRSSVPAGAGAAATGIYQGSQQQ